MRIPMTVVPVILVALIVVGCSSAEEPEAAGGGVASTTEDALAVVATPDPTGESVQAYCDVMALMDGQLEVLHDDDRKDEVDARIDYINELDTQAEAVAPAEVQAMGEVRRAQGDDRLDVWLADNCDIRFIDGDPSGPVDLPEGTDVAASTSVEEPDTVAITEDAVLCETYREAVTLADDDTERSRLAAEFADLANNPELSGQFSAHATLFGDGTSVAMVGQPAACDALVEAAIDLNQ